MGRIKLFMIFLSPISVLFICICITNKLGHSQEPCCGWANRDNMEMMQDMMSGRLPPGIEPEDLPETDSTGAKLIVRYCTQCHNLPSPSMHTTEERPAVVERMQVNMKIMDKPVITDQEKEKIIMYLDKHAKQ